MLNAVILRSIAKEVDLRYAHYSEMMYDLERPQGVKPFFTKERPLLERDPLRFYKVGFVLSLFANMIALLMLLK